MGATLGDLTQRLQTRRQLPPPDVRRTLRRVAGASQSDVAEVVGVTRQAVHLWEAGVRTPRGSNLDAYLEVLAAFRRVVSEEEPLKSASPALAGDLATRDETDDANGSGAV
jgi:DNA-binding transcriptional regulator YiaG